MTARVVVRGAIDCATEPAFARALGRSRRARALELDLTGCTYLSARGLAAILRERERRNGRLAVLAAPASLVERIVDVCGLRDALALRLRADCGVTAWQRQVRSSEDRRDRVDVEVGGRDGDRDVGGTGRRARGRRRFVAAIPARRR